MPRQVPVDVSYLTIEHRDEPFKQKPFLTSNRRFDSIDFGKAMHVCCWTTMFKLRRLSLSSRISINWSVGKDQH